MESLRLLIQLDFSRELHPGDIDDLITQVASLIEGAALSGELAAESADLEDYDVRFELFED